jgi:hypothetical protein
VRLERARIVIRERSLGETLDLVPPFIFTLAPKLLARLAALTLLPPYLLCLLTRVGGCRWGSVWVLAVTLGTVLQGVFTVAASRVVFSEDVSARAVLRQFGARLSAYLVALSGALLVLGLGAATVVLLPVAWARMAFVHEACLLEQASGRAALGRAARMVAHRMPAGMQMIAALLLGQVAIILVTELLGQGLVGFVLQCGEPFGSLFSQGGSPCALAGYFLGLPVVATARFLAYIEQRTRQDGWDVQVRFQAIQAASPERAT